MASRHSRRSYKSGSSRKAHRDEEHQAKDQQVSQNRNFVTTHATSSQQQEGLGVEGDKGCQHYSQTTPRLSSHKSIDTSLSDGEANQLSAHEGFFQTTQGQDVVNWQWRMEVLDIQAPEFVQQSFVGLGDVVIENTCTTQPHEASFSLHHSCTLSVLTGLPARPGQSSSRTVEGFKDEILAGVGAQFAA